MELPELGVGLQAIRGCQRLGTLSSDAIVSQAEVLEWRVDLIIRVRVGVRVGVRPRYSSGGEICGIRTG